MAKKKQTAKQKAASKAYKERVKKLNASILRSVKEISPMIRAGINREKGLRGCNLGVSKRELNRRIAIAKKIKKHEDAIRNLYREITRPSGKRL